MYFDCIPMTDCPYHMTHLTNAQVNQDKEIILLHLRRRSISHMHVIEPEGPASRQDKVMLSQTSSPTTYTEPTARPSQESRV